MLIAVGVLFLLDRLHVADFGDVVRMYWPMIVVIFGISHLLRRESVWSGVWLISAGVWLQCVRLHLLGLTYSNSWPLMLIALGAGVTLRALTDRGAAKREGEASER
jgi:hypothetical protein